MPSALTKISQTALISILCMAPLVSRAQPCPSDCNEDREVTLAEILKVINIALGHADLSSCRFADDNFDGRLTIDELVSAVNTAMNQNGQPEQIVANGFCLTPGSNDLTDCEPGTLVRAFRCDDPRRCLRDGAARTLLGEGRIGEGGEFALRATGRLARCARILFEANVQGTEYVTINYGLAGNGSGSALPSSVTANIEFPLSPTPTPAAIDGVEISPLTSAVAELADKAGLELVTNNDYNALTLGVLAAAEDVDFADRTPRAAIAAIDFAFGLSLAAEPTPSLPLVFRVVDFGFCCGPTPTPTGTPPTSVSTPAATATPTNTRPPGLPGVLMPCDAQDTYTFDSQLGASVEIIADTTDPDTAADLCLRGTCGFTLFEADDEISCRFPPPLFGCPRASIVTDNVLDFGPSLTTTDTPCEVTVTTCSASCEDVDRVDYDLTVLVNGERVLLQ